MNAHVRRLIDELKEGGIRRRRNRALSSREVSPYHWAPPSGFGFVRNFGDELVARAFEFLNSGSCEWNRGGTYDRKLYVGGSVIDMARDGDVVWGAGIRDPSTPMYFRTNLKVFSVRGPLTRHFLMARGVECPAVYGDPGILVSRLYPECRSVTRDVPRGIVPHYSEYEHTMQRFQADSGVMVIDPRRGPDEVALDIARCECIASSSLHGIIVAESLGIPVFWWRESEREPYFKYYDYYLSTKRAGNPIENLDAGFERLKSSSRESIDFSGQIEGLLDSFARMKKEYSFLEG
ncbi:MAG: polysaccharide pyruvyl transferase family protein [Pontiellaceae bacterium]|nr:polysaccharide pyruvyl transferase family protein [Pontiellaceae bacterium]MBN2784000.1 polysaccharide pyruvyl transferase family protein [Pontiellaceae bacterium]